MARKVAVFVMMVLAGVGCGTDKDPNELPNAVKNYSHAMLTSDENAAWDLLSERCRGRIGRKDIGGVADLLAARFVDEAPLITDIKSQEKPPRAIVSYTFPEQPDLNQTNEPWVYEGEGWHNDEC